MVYGLMEVVERQQALVQATLEGMAAERADLMLGREALARGWRACSPARRMPCSRPGRMQTQACPRSMS